MHRLGAVNPNGREMTFSLRELRTAKGITQRQLAHVLKISPTLYNAIEKGHRKPSIDVLYVLAAIYETSMDFVYHAFHRQHFVWYYPNEYLEYSMRKARKIDIQYLRDRSPPPEPPPTLPVAIVMERMEDEPTVVEEKFRPYGLDYD